MKEYYLRVAREKEEGVPVAWMWTCTPSELVRGLGLNLFTVEYHSGFLCGREGFHRYLEAAEQAGYPRDACSFQKSYHGRSLLGEQPMILPPDVLVASTSCDSSPRGLLLLADHYGLPYYLLDLPWNGEACEGPGLPGSSVAYLAAQLEEMVSVLERVAGRPTDPERLADTYRRANTLYQLWEDIIDLKATVPCPVGITDSIAASGILMQFAGTQEGIDFAQRMRDEVGDRAARKEGVLEEERYRILWLGPVVNYDLGLFRRFEELGAVVLQWELESSYTGSYGGILDPDNPLESMARKMVSNLYNGAVENRMAAIKRLAGRLKVDGLVLYNSWPCKRLAGSQRAIKEGVARDLGLPLLFLEADSVDSRSHDPETLNQQIEDFVEVLG